MKRLDPALLPYDNAMEDYREQEADRAARELYAVIANGEGITEQEAEALFIEQLGRMSPPERTLSEKLGTVVFVMGLLALGIWFCWECVMEASR